MKKQELRQLFYLALPILVALLIFRNSMFPGELSDEQSNFVLQFIENLFSRVGISATLTSFAVRKLAHLTEYFIFGLTLSLSFWKRGKSIFPSSMFWFLAVPFVDETIQLFCPGRNGSVVDVWIDFAGCLIGLGLLYLIKHFVESRHRKIKGTI
jgi:VanZ family protein